MRNIIYYDPTDIYINADIDISASSHRSMSRSSRQGIQITDAAQIFAIIGERHTDDNPWQRHKYTTIVAGLGRSYDFLSATEDECEFIDLLSMMEELNAHDPDLFFDLLAATMAAASKDQLDDAFLTTVDPPEDDIVVFLNRKQLAERLDSKTIAEFIDELYVAICEYVDSDQSVAIDGHHFYYDSPDDLYLVAVNTDTPDDEAAALTCEIIDNVIDPLLEKYGITDPENPDGTED